MRSSHPFPVGRWVRFTVPSTARPAPRSRSSACSTSATRPASRSRRGCWPASATRAWSRCSTTRATTRASTSSWTSSTAWTWARSLKRSGDPGLTLGDAIEYVRHGCEALSYVHSQQIVHRDVKPQNMILGEDGVILVDFGVARALGAEEDQGTIAVGTPRFMAPEVFAGGTVSAPPATSSASPRRSGRCWSARRRATATCSSSTSSPRACRRSCRPRSPAAWRCCPSSGSRPRRRSPRPSASRSPATAATRWPSASAARRRAGASWRRSSAPRPACSRPRPARSR